MIRDEIQNKAIQDLAVEEAEARGEARGIKIGEARGEARGIEIGKATGIKIGEAMGIEIGKVSGIEIGKAKEREKNKEEKRQAASALKAAGVDPMTISKAMGIPIEELDNLR